MSQYISQRQPPLLFYGVYHTPKTDLPALGVMLGHGRYDKANNNWGHDIAFQAKLVIDYEDGRCQTIVTDESWQVYDDGPIRNDDMYLGEYYDAGFAVQCLRISDGYDLSPPILCISQCELAVTIKILPEIPAKDISGLVISTDNRRTGEFVCSDESVNRLYESIYWTHYPG